MAGKRSRAEFRPVNHSEEASLVVMATTSLSIDLTSILESSSLIDCAALLRTVESSTVHSYSRGCKRCLIFEAPPTCSNSLPKFSARANMTSSSSSMSSVEVKEPTYQIRKGATQSEFSQSRGPGPPCRGSTRHSLYTVTSSNLLLFGVLTSQLVNESGNGVSFH